MQRGGISKIGAWGGPFFSGHGKKITYHGLVHPEMHKFYMKTNPRQKLGDAEACASVAPMPLHPPICHAGINIQLIIAQQRGDGGGVFLHDWHLGAACRLLPRHLVLGIIFRSAGRHPKT